MGKFDCLPFLYAAVTKLGDVVQWKVLRPVDCRLPASRRLFLLLTLLTSEKASDGFNPTSCYASADFDADFSGIGDPTALCCLDIFCHTSQVTFES